MLLLTSNIRTTTLKVIPNPLDMSSPLRWRNPSTFDSTWLTAAAGDAEVFPPTVDHQKPRASRCATLSWYVEHIFFTLERHSLNPLMISLVFGRRALILRAFIFNCVGLFLTPLYFVLGCLFACNGISIVSTVPESGAAASSCPSRHPRHPAAADDIEAPPAGAAAEVTDGGSSQPINDATHQLVGGATGTRLPAAAGSSESKGRRRSTTTKKTSGVSVSCTEALMWLPLLYLLLWIILVFKLFSYDIDYGISDQRPDLEEKYGRPPNLLEYMNVVTAANYMLSIRKG